MSHSDTITANERLLARPAPETARRWLSRNMAAATVGPGERVDRTILERPQADRFIVSVDADWQEVAETWRSLAETCSRTPFQAFAWLDNWYHEIAPATGATPRLVTVRDAANRLVMLLPLASTRERRGQVLHFADAELTDFNAPLLGPVDVAAGAERELWRALRAALPGHAVAEFRKLPRLIDGRPNPLVRLPGAQPSRVASNVLALDGTFADFHQRIERRARVETERYWRILRRDHNVQFEHVTCGTRAAEVLAAMDRQQRERFTEIGAGFSLDEPAQAAFYRRDLARRLADGAVQLTCLRVGADVIAANYAISDGRTAVVLRLANAGKDWARYSPGRLVLHRSIEHYYAQGLQVCDLSVGDYDYKRRFGAVRTPLVDLVGAMSWRGRPAATMHWAIGRLRTYPAIDRRVRDLASAWQARRRALPGK